MKDDRILGLLVTAPKPQQYDSGSMIWKIGLVCVGENEKITNVTDDREWDDLTFKVYVSWKYPEEAPVFQASSVECAYVDPYSIDLRRAEYMVKMLKRVAKISSGLVTGLTPAQWITAMCKALGVKHAVRQRGEGRAMWHNETDYQVMPIASAQYFIEQALDKFSAEMLPKREGVTA